MAPCAVCSGQANESAIKAPNHRLMSSKWSPFQPSEAPKAAGTAVIERVAALYWNTACSHDAWVIVMVEKHAELVTGAGSGAPPAKMRDSASAQTFASWLAMWPAFGCVVALESPITCTRGAAVLA